jgi:hypothetical protein
LTNSPSAGNRQQGSISDHVHVADAALLRLGILTLTFVATVTLRVWHIDIRFWLLEDQIRDWGIALRPLAEMPLVGPPTHVHGYTIGPAFYWILWLIRVSVGPWFENLPHAGGIGQAILQSAADTILLAAIWRRTASVWIALATTALLTTASLDLSLSALVWNPMAGSALAKIAIAMVLLKWHERSALAAVVTVAIAWSAVQCYTGAVFVAIGIFAAVLAGPLVRRDRSGVLRQAAIIVFTVAVLQVPYVVHQLSIQFSDTGMTAVTDSISRVVSGHQSPEFVRSWNGYTRAFMSLLISPLRGVWAVWMLVVCSVVVASRFRYDVPVLSVTLLPQAAAIAGYAFFVGNFLDDYFYLSLMPSAALTLMFSVTAVRPAPLARALSVGLLAGVLAIAPARIRTASTLFSMPEYAALVEGSRQLARQQRPLRAIQTEFTLPHTSNPQFVYTILGGHIDPGSSTIGIIKSDGRIDYKEAGGL